MAVIRSDSAHTVWPYSCGSADVSAPAAAEERGKRQLWEQCSLRAAKRKEWTPVIGSDHNHPSYLKTLHPQHAHFWDVEDQDHFFSKSAGQERMYCRFLAWFPRAWNLKEGINTFNEYILHARPRAQRFTIIISLNPHHKLVRQLILCPFYGWGNPGRTRTVLGQRVAESAGLQMPGFFRVLMSCWDRGQRHTLAD